MLHHYNSHKYILFCILQIMDYLFGQFKVEYFDLKPNIYVYQLISSKCKPTKCKLLVVYHTL